MNYQEQIEMISEWIETLRDHISSNIYLNQSKNSYNVIFEYVDNDIRIIIKLFEYSKECDNTNFNFKKYFLDKIRENYRKKYIPTLQKINKEMINNQNLFEFTDLFNEVNVSTVMAPYRNNNLFPYLNVWPIYEDWIDDKWNFYKNLTLEERNNLYKCDFKINENINDKKNKKYK